MNPDLILWIQLKMWLFFIN